MRRTSFAFGTVTALILVGGFLRAAPKPVPGPPVLTLSPLNSIVYRYIDPDGATKTCFGEDSEAQGAIVGRLKAGHTWISVGSDLRMCAPDDCMIVQDALDRGLQCEAGWGTGGDTESVVWQVTPPKGSLAQYLAAELIYAPGGEDPWTHETVKPGFWRAASVWARCDRSDPAYLGNYGNDGCLAIYHLWPGNYQFRLTNSHPTKDIDVYAYVRVTSVGAYGAQAFAPGGDSPAPPGVNPGTWLLNNGDRRVTFIN